MPTYSTGNVWYIPESAVFELTEDEGPDFDENLPKDLKDFRRKLELMQCGDGLGVIVVAVSKKDDMLNDTRAIPALAGEPINVGCYDMVKDQYLVHCHSYLDLGAIPINYKLCIKGVHDWLIDVPVPMPVIERYLTDTQKKSLDNWKTTLGNPKDFIFETIQAIHVY